MKNLSLSFLVILSLLVGCSKKSESPSFKKADFTGVVWEKNGSSDGDCTEIVKFDDTKMYEGYKCDGDQDFDSGVTYTYDNKSTITIDPSNGFNVKYVIVSLNATTLKVDYYLSNVKFGTDTYTKL